MRISSSGPRLPFYRRMLLDAGFPEAKEGTWSDAMIDALGIWGAETRVADKLRELLSFGAAEVLASLIVAGPDRKTSTERTMSLLGQVAQAVAA